MKNLGGLKSEILRYAQNDKYSGVSGLVFAKEDAASVRGPTVYKFAIARFAPRRLLPLTLALSPIGGEGKKWNRFNAYVY